MQLLPDLTNTQVVERLKAGDGAAFEQLYQACYRMVFFQANKILGNEDEAQSVVQDVFVTVFRSIHRLLDPEALRSWIGGITVRLALKRRQQLRSSRELVLEEEAMLDILNTGGQEGSPEEDLCRQDTGRILGELVDELPQEQRETVMLFYYDQCAVKEIAQIMSCAEGTVKSRLNYARRQLEKRILQREQREGIRLHAVNPALLFLAFAMQEQQIFLDPDTVRRGLEAAKAVLGLAAAGGAAAGGAAATGGAAAGSTAAGAGSGAAALSGTTGAASIAAAGGLGSKVIALMTAGALLAGTGGVLFAQETLTAPVPSPSSGQVAALVPVTPTSRQSLSPSSTPSPTMVPTPGPTATPSPYPTTTPAVTPAPSSNPSPTPTPRSTPSPTPRPTPSPTPAPAATQAPSDGTYYTNYYRQDYKDGQYLQVQLSGNTLTASGMRVLDNSLYNYVVLSTTGNRAEIPFVSGQPFQLSIQVDLDILRQIEEEKPGSPYAYSILSLTICQNYTPGDTAYGGVSFQKVSLGAMRSGNGCTIKVIPN